MTHASVVGTVRKTALTELSRWPTRQPPNSGSGHGFYLAQTLVQDKSNQQAILKKPSRKPRSAICAVG